MCRGKFTHCEIVVNEHITFHLLTYSLNCISLNQILYFTYFLTNAWSYINYFLSVWSSHVIYFDLFMFTEGIILYKDVICQSLWEFVGFSWELDNDQYKCLLLSCGLMLLSHTNKLIKNHFQKYRCCEMCVGMHFVCGVPVFGDKANQNQTHMKKDTMFILHTNTWPFSHFRLAIIWYDDGTLQPPNDPCLLMGWPKHI